MRRLTCRAWLLGVGIVALTALASSAQIIQSWTHQAAIGESSAVIGLGKNCMFVADNEDEILRLYERCPNQACAAPIYEFNARPFLNLSSSSPEDDLEAAVKVVAENGTRIYWLGSHSNSKTGKSRPNRYRLFATQVHGDGNGSPPYSLDYVGRYDHLRTDLIAWDRDNLHGKGANYFGLAASAAIGVAFGRIDGFNIEGLAMAPDGRTALIAFRAPLVNRAGPTTSDDQRTDALIVPLLNMPDLVNGSPTPGPGAAQFGVPFTLDLGTRGVRSIDSAQPGHYLITAGPPEQVTLPTTPPYNFRLFTWSGDPADQPVEQLTQFPAGFSPEGAILPPGPITTNTVAFFVSDDGSGCWRSFAAPAAPAAEVLQPGSPPTVQVWPMAEDRTCLRINGETGLEYVVEASTNLRDWVECFATRPPALPFYWVDPDTAQCGARCYRVYCQQ